VICEADFIDFFDKLTTKSAEVRKKAVEGMGRPELLGENL